jgi:hypothetical protein
MPESPGMSHDDLESSVHAQPQYFLEQQLILGDFIENRPGATTPTIEFVLPVFYNAVGWCFIAI